MKNKISRLLDKEEEYALVERAQAGDDRAMEELISSNMGLS